MGKRFLVIALCVVSWMALEDRLLACACGCGVFEVTSTPLVSKEPGRLFFLNVDALDQYQNFHHDAVSDADNNEDKDINSHFVTAEFQYRLNNQWGLQAEIPFGSRIVNGETGVSSFGGLGDIRVSGVYTGFSSDLSTGVSMGIQFPTGEYTRPDTERDLQMGTGSTDLLLGAYHVQNLGNDEAWTVLSRFRLNAPVLTSGGYIPGGELNTVVGIRYQGWALDQLTLSPLLQMVGTLRWRDSGTSGNTDNSGYERLLLSPGLEMRFGSWYAYTDIGFPVYQYVNGEQLVASSYLKFSLGQSL